MWAATVAWVEKWKGFKSEYRNPKQMQMTEIKNIDDMIQNTEPSHLPKGL
jgi:23S rRNA maturation-related 3'-5' exoribonuclease YhaM